MKTSNFAGVDYKNYCDTLASNSWRDDLTYDYDKCQQYYLLIINLRQSVDHGTSELEAQIKVDDFDKNLLNYQGFYNIGDKSNLLTPINFVIAKDLQGNILKILLENGARIDHYNLYHAVVSGNNAAVKIFLEFSLSNGSNISKKNLLEFNPNICCDKLQKMSPLHIAVINQDVDMIKTLLSSGAKLIASSKDDPSSWNAAKSILNNNECAIANNDHIYSSSTDDDLVMKGALFMCLLSRELLHYLGRYFWPKQTLTTKIVEVVVAGHISFAYYKSLKSDYNEGCAAVHKEFKSFKDHPLSYIFDNNDNPKLVINALDNLKDQPDFINVPAKEVIDHIRGCVVEYAVEESLDKSLQDECFFSNTHDFKIYSASHEAYT